MLARERWGSSARLLRGTGNKVSLALLRGIVARRLTWTETGLGATPSLYHGPYITRTILLVRFYIAQVIPCTIMTTTDDAPLYLYVC